MPLAVLGIVIALITPLPGFVLDLLIVTDITAVGDRAAGRRCTSCGRSSSASFPPRCCC